METVQKEGATGTKTRWPSRVLQQRLQDVIEAWCSRGQQRRCRCWGSRADQRSIEVFQAGGYVKANLPLLPSFSGKISCVITSESHLFLSSTALPSALRLQGGYVLDFPIAYGRHQCWKPINWRMSEGEALVCLLPGQSHISRGWGRGSVLAPGLGYVRLPETGGLKLKHLLLTALGSGKSKIRCGRPSVQWGPTSWLADGRLFAVSSHGGRQTEHAPPVSVMRALNPFMGAPPSWPIVPKGPTS